MEQLKVLQDQFKEAAKQYPKVTGVSVYKKMAGGDCKTKGKTSREKALQKQIENMRVVVKPEHNQKPERTVAYWLTDAAQPYNGDFWQELWLLQPPGVTWDKAQVKALFTGLTQSAIDYIIQERERPVICSLFAEIGPSLANSHPAQSWLAIVRYMRPGKYPKIVKENQGFTLAETDGKGYWAIDNVFLESAFVLGDIVTAVEKIPPALYVKPITLRHFIGIVTIATQPNRQKSFADALRKADKAGTITLPQHIGEWKSGKPLFYDPAKLLAGWRDEWMQKVSLPDFKPEFNPK